jgi:hypothetical protein
MQLAGRVLLILALLIARGGAVAHAYSHLATDPPSLPTQTCGECLSFAPLYNLAGGAPEPVLIHHRDAGSDVQGTDLPVVCVSRPAPFQSRAPPALL